MSRLAVSNTRRLGWLVNACSIRWLVISATRYKPPDRGGWRTQGINTGGNFETMSMAQARYWLLTIPHADFLPYLPPNTAYIRGQLELGAGRNGLNGNVLPQDEEPLQRAAIDNDEPPIANPLHNNGELVAEPNGRPRYLHWQILVILKRKLRLGGVKTIFGRTCHAEPSRSNAADDYVWKEDTRVPNTQFELGERPLNRANSADWEAIKLHAKRGRLDDIPGDIFVRNYGNLKRISVDYCEPVALEREVKVYWGPTGVGKSHRAWGEAGVNAYPKDPRSKFWDGYRDQEHVVIDEFRGDIDVAHVLRWFDKYPVIVEVKGSSVVFKARKIWITSNLDPNFWYPNLDALTRDALMRRLNIVNVTERME